MLNRAAILPTGKCWTGNRGKEWTLMRRRWQGGSLQKVGRNWIARWREDCIGSDGKPARRFCYTNLGGVTKEVARQKLSELVNKENAGRRLPRPLITFEDFVHQQWAPAEMPMLDPATLKLNRDEARKGTANSEHRPASADTYGSKIRTHLLPYFGPKALGEITRYDVELFLTEKSKQGYSRAHLKAMCATLSKILEAAVRWKLLEENPARGVPVNKGNNDRKRPAVVLAPRQLRRLAAALPEPCRTVLLVAVLTGLRIGELLALAWDRIDFKGGTILVNRSLCDRVQVLGPTKTRTSCRVLWMSNALRTLLSAHRSRNLMDGVGLVFTTAEGTPLSAKNLRNRVLDPARKKLGLPVISWHDLRHTHATIHSQAGVHPRVTQAILGHSDPSLTMNTYTHVVPASQRDAMERVAQHMNLNVIERKSGRQAAR